MKGGERADICQEKSQPIHFWFYFEDNGPHPHFAKTRRNYFFHEYKKPVNKIKKIIVKKKTNTFI